jgi:hypothetical protein
MAPLHSSLSCTPPGCLTNTPLCLSLRVQLEAPAEKNQRRKKNLCSLVRPLSGEMAGISRAIRASYRRGLAAAAAPSTESAAAGLRAASASAGRKGRDREARAVGVPGVSRRRQGHLRQPPLAAARRPPHRHRRSRPRRARLTRSRLQAGKAICVASRVLLFSFQVVWVSSGR